MQVIVTKVNSHFPSAVLAQDMACPNTLDTSEPHLCPNCAHERANKPQAPSTAVFAQLITIIWDIYLLSFFFGMSIFQLNNVQSKSDYHSRESSIRAKAQLIALRTMGFSQ